MSTLQTGSPVHHRAPIRRVGDSAYGDRQTSCAPHGPVSCNVRAAPRSRRHARVQRVCSFVEGEAHVRTDPSNRRLGGAVVRVPVLRVRRNVKHTWRHPHAHRAVPRSFRLYRPVTKTQKQT